MNAVLLSDDPAIADVQATRLAYSNAVEFAISQAALDLSTATTPELRAKAWTRLQWLHGQRLPESVRGMEEGKGLR